MTEKHDADIRISIPCLDRLERATADEQERAQLRSCLGDVRLVLEIHGEHSAAVVVSQAREMIDRLMSELKTCHRDLKQAGEWLAESGSTNQKLQSKLSTAEETHRMQLAAISVAAMCNTEESDEKQRIERENPYWTPAYEDARSAVARERALLLRLEKWHQEIRRLFGLLDDIDTAEDAYKPEQTEWFKYVHQQQRRRFDGITSTDGYTISIADSPAVETRCRNLVKIEGAQWSEECVLPRGHDGGCCHGQPGVDCPAHPMTEENQIPVKYLCGCGAAFSTTSELRAHFAKCGT